MHKEGEAVEVLCNADSAVSRKQSGVLEGQWQLPLGVPRRHSVREEYRRCGSGGCATCRDGQGHGPYLYAVWRDGTKTRRKYLGKAATALTAPRTGKRRG